MIFFIVNIHICMLFTTPQFNVFIYYAHACLFRLELFVCLLLKKIEEEGRLANSQLVYPLKIKNLLTYLLYKNKNNPVF